MTMRRVFLAAAALCAVPVVGQAQDDKLKARCAGQTLGALISQIVEEWLVGKPMERYANGKKTKEWKSAVRKAEQ